MTYAYFTASPKPSLSVTLKVFRLVAFGLVLFFFYLSVTAFSNGSIIAGVATGVNFVAFLEVLRGLSKLLDTGMLSNPRPSVGVYPSITQYALSEQSEYVYILQDVSNSLYFKIGRTNQPKQRLHHFSVTLPIVIHVVHIIPCTNCRVAERTLHNRFHHLRKRGEWFALSDQDVAWLLAIERL